MQESGNKGLAQLQQGLASRQAMGAEMLMPMLLTLLAEVFGKRGQSEAGLTVLDEALTLVENNAERYFEADIHRLKGELLQNADGEINTESVFSARP